MVWYEMLMVIRESIENYSGAAMLYSEQNPERGNHSRMVFQRLVLVCLKQFKYKLTETRKRKLRGLIGSLRFWQEYRWIQQKIWRILKIISYTLTACLYIRNCNDFLYRTNFFIWTRERLKQNPYFFRNFLWRDEATFHSNGEVNSYSMK